MTALSLKSKIFHGIHLFGLAGVAIGLPFNKIVLSIALMLLLANLTVQATFKKYWDNLRSNHLFWLICAFWLLHLVGLFWTKEIDFAFRDIRVKLPLIILPLVLSAQPVTKKELKYLVLIFVGAVFITSIINFLAYQQVFGERMYTDVRGMSLFGSHIRYGIMVGFAATICTYFSIKNRNNYALVFLVIILWFTYYTYISEVISGLIALVVGISAIVLPLICARNKKLVFGFISLVLLCIIGIGVVIFSKPKIEKFNLSAASKTTKEGNAYVHELNEYQDVYGGPLFTYWCELELRREWNKQSEINYDSLDLRQQDLRYTLLRYMASKKLHKDAEGFQKLSKIDISNVENGLTEDPTLFRGFWNRVNGIRYQIHYTNDPNGHSMLQRFEFWKTGVQIAKNNWLFGVGTGDTQIAFDHQYAKMNSKLNKEHRMRAHNTYLTVWITFGVLAFLFYYLLFAFTKSMILKKDYLGLAFILITIITFLIEDTLETQAGVTFFAYFYALFGARGNDHSQFPSTSQDSPS